MKTYEVVPILPNFDEQGYWIPDIDEIWTVSAEEVKVDSVVIDGREVRTTVKFLIADRIIAIFPFNYVWKIAEIGTMNMDKYKDGPTEDELNGQKTFQAEKLS